MANRSGADLELRALIARAGFDPDDASVYRFGAALLEQLADEFDLENISNWSVNTLLTEIESYLFDGVRRSVGLAVDPSAGFLDRDFKIGSSGYGLHLTASRKTGSLVTGARYVVAIGVDDPADLGGLLISHKSTTSAGLEINQHPGCGVGIYVKGRSTGFAEYHEVYVGNQGIKNALYAGQGFADGSSTAGSTVFTSASASFTAEDVGRSLAQTGAGDNSILDSIPSGTTIISITNATTVVLSQPAAKTSNNIRFIIIGRTPSSTQKLENWIDYDGSTIAEILQGSISTRRPFTIRNVDPATVPLTVLGQASQSADLFGIIRSGDADNLVEVSSAGKLVTRAGLAAANAIGSTQTPLQVLNSSASVDSMLINAASGQTADQFRLQSNGGTAQSRFDKDGRFGTRVTSAPIDANVAPNEIMFWFDSTAGASKLMFKARDAGNTVRTGSVTLV